MQVTICNCRRLERRILLKLIHGASLKEIRDPRFPENVSNYESPRWKQLWPLVGFTTAPHRFHLMYTWILIVSVISIAANDR